MAINIQRGHTNVMGVMKMGNTVPREGPEPTSLAFRTIALCRLHDVTLSMQLLVSEVSADYYINKGLAGVIQLIFPINQQACH